MPSGPLHRQVLVLTDDVCIRNLFYLMRRLASEDAENGSFRAMMAIAEREHYDAIILDMRRLDGQPGDELREIGKIQSSQIDRMLTITAEVYRRKTLTLVERYLLNGLPGALAWLAGSRYASRRQLQPC